jgi:hypothetical protein
VQTGLRRPDASHSRPLYRRQVDGSITGLANEGMNSFEQVYRIVV